MGFQVQVKTQSTGFEKARQKHVLLQSGSRVSSFWRRLYKYKFDTIEIDQKHIFDMLFQTLTS